MAWPVAVVAGDVPGFRARALVRVILFALLGPFNVERSAAHFLAVELFVGIFGVLFILKVDEGKRSLWNLDFAGAELAERGFQVAQLDVLGQVSHEEMHLSLY